MAAKLEGVRVLDISRVLAGPYCTMVLGDLGAEVIKVEPPEGDETRTWPPFFPNGESGYFMSLNRNKKGIVLNLKNPKGKEILFELAKKSDVLLENFTPGVVKRLGIDYESIKEINPKIIYCSISGFGQTGPYRLKKAYDPVIQALGGAMSVTGTLSGDPIKLGIPVGDLGGSFMAISSILASLFARDRQGIGDYIDISMLDGQVFMLSVMTAPYFTEGKVPGPQGLEHPMRVPSKTFKTKNGYITSTATSGSQYPILCRMLGLEELIDDPRFKTNALRVKNRVQMYAILDPIFLTKTSEEWEELFRKAELPSGILKKVDQVFSDPHVLHREMLQFIDHPTVGRIKAIGFPFKFLNNPPKKMTPPPMLGEHTDEILGQVLGYDAGQITRLREGKVVA